MKIACPSPQKNLQSKQPELVETDNLVSTGLWSTYPTLCKCSKRWQCVECRRYWASKRFKSQLSWLNSVVSSKTQSWFVLFSIRTTDDYENDVNELFRRWDCLCRLRAKELRRKVPTGLGNVNRGVASLHVVNKQGEFQPHLHAIFVANKFRISQSEFIDAWTSFGEGYTDAQVCRSLNRALWYSIHGSLPSTVKRQLVSKVLNRKRVVRRIGS